MQNPFRAWRLHLGNMEQDWGGGVFERVFGLGKRKEGQAAFPMSMGMDLKIGVSPRFQSAYVYLIQGVGIYFILSTSDHVIIGS